MRMRQNILPLLRSVMSQSDGFAVDTFGTPTHQRDMGQFDT